MPSVQAELSSARLIKESAGIAAGQSSHLPDTPSHSTFEEISARIGRRFSADLAAILRNSVGHPGKAHLTPTQDSTENDSYAIRQFVFTALRAGNFHAARDFLLRHAPEQMAWLEAQIDRSGSYKRSDDDRPTSPAGDGFLSKETQNNGFWYKGNLFIILPQRY